MVSVAVEDAMFGRALSHSSTKRALTPQMKMVAICYATLPALHIAFRTEKTMKRVREKRIETEGKWVMPQII